MATTPNMNLDLPVVSSTVGPTYAAKNNTAFTAIDSHDHTPGKGVPVPSAGINVNADLPFNSFNATALRSVRFTSQGSPIATASDVSCLYVSGGNLYYNNGSGTQIQITAGAALNAASIGGIGGDYATSSASVFYTSASKTFTFTQATNQSAKLDIGPLTIRDTAASANGISILSPVGLGAAYQLTLPTGLPGSTSLFTCDASGNVAFSTTPTLTGLTVNGNAAVTGTLTIGSSGVALSNDGGALRLAGANGSLVSLLSTRTMGIQTAGTSTKFPIVVSATPATHGLMILRGAISAGGTILRGEGFTVTKTGTGTYQINFSTAFAETPIAVGTAYGDSRVLVTIITGSDSTSQTTFATRNYLSDASVDLSFEFIIIGQRGA